MCDSYEELVAVLFQHRKCRDQNLRGSESIPGIFQFKKIILVHQNRISIKMMHFFKFFSCSHLHFGSSAV